MGFIEREDVMIVGPRARARRSFALDSGSEVSFLPVDLARKLQLPVVGYGPVRTPAGTLRRVPIVRATLWVRNHRFDVDLQALPGEMFALGMDVLPQLRFCVT